MCHMSHVTCHVSYVTCRIYIHIYIITSDQRIVIFPTNRNRNRFAEPTSVQIGIGIVCEFQNLQIGIGIIFVRWEVFANNSQIPEVYFFSKKCLKISFSLLLYIFDLKKFKEQTKPY